MLEKSREGATKGNLGALKSANSIYYGDYPGLWPSTLDTATHFRYSMYLDGIPMVKVTGKYNPSGSLSPVGGSVLQVPLGTLPSSQSTGWMYDSTRGQLYVNSTLQDSKKVAYSFYGLE
jgi:hypothetical protein